MIQTIMMGEINHAHTPKSAPSHRRVAGVPSLDTIDTTGLDTDDDSCAAMETFTDMDEDSTIVSSARSLNYEHDSVRDDDGDSSESTIDLHNSGATFVNDSLTFSSDVSSPELSYEDYYGASSKQEKDDKDSKHQEEKPVDKGTQGKRRSLLTSETLRALDANPVQDVPLRFSQAKRRMSLGEMESIMETAFRSYKSMSQPGNSQRRLSFAAAVEQKYDNTAPACEMAQGCLRRRESWARRKKKNTHFTTTSTSGGLSEPTKKPQKRLKSVLKLFPRFSRKTRRRASLVAEDYIRGGSGGSGSAPKQPVRTASSRSLTSSTGESAVVTPSHKEVRWGAPQNVSAPPSMPRPRR